MRLSYNPTRRLSWQATAFTGTHYLTQTSPSPVTTAKVLLTRALAPAACHQRRRFQKSHSPGARALGPSLLLGDSGVLADPVLELHAPDGVVITNDDWKDSQEQEVVGTGIPPTNDLESAIVAPLEPGAYTAVVRGKYGESGVGLVELYDLDEAVSKLPNISGRGFVGSGDNVIIAGIILAGENNTAPSWYVGSGHH